MTTNISYVLHWHQKQRNAHQADDLILSPEGYQEAIYKFYPSQKSTDCCLKNSAAKLSKMWISWK